jgi:hypothetical protein
MKAVRILLVAMVVALFAIPVVHSDAQEAPADPTDTVLAILSPLASPVCGLAGTSTLLVPIVSGLISSSLPSGVPSVGDLLLNSIGPVFVVCGELPSSAGTRCQLDDQISGLLPIEVSSLTGPLPALLGNLIDALNAAMSALGLPPQTALQEALVCTVNQGPGVTEAPGGDAPVEPPPPIEDLPVAAPSFTPVAGSPLPALPTPTAQPAAPRTAPQELIATVDRLVPGGIKVLQIVAISLLGLTLLSGWVGSWMESRRTGTPS